MVVTPLEFEDPSEPLPDVVPDPVVPVVPWGPGGEGVGFTVMAVAFPEAFVTEKSPDTAPFA